MKPLVIWAVAILLLVCVSQAEPVGRISRAVETKHVVVKRQLPANPLEIANTIFRLLSLLNIPLTPTQILQVFQLARDIIRIVQRIQQGLTTIQNAIRQITQLLSRLLNCQPDPILDGITVAILRMMLTPLGIPVNWSPEDSMPPTTNDTARS